MSKCCYLHGKITWHEYSIIQVLGFYCDLFFVDRSYTLQFLPVLWINSVVEKSSRLQVSIASWRPCTYGERIETWKKTYPSTSLHVYLYKTADRIYARRNSRAFKKTFPSTSFHLIQTKITTLIHLANQSGICYVEKNVSIKKFPVDEYKTDDTAKQSGRTKNVEYYKIIIQKILTNIPHQHYHLNPKIFRHFRSSTGTFNSTSSFGFNKVAALCETF